MDSPRAKEMPPTNQMLSLKLLTILLGLQHKNQNQYQHDERVLKMA